MKLTIFSLSYDTEYGTGTDLYASQDDRDASLRASIAECFDDEDLSAIQIDDLSEKFHSENKHGDSLVRETHVVDVPLKIKVYYYTWDTEDGIGTCIFNTAEKRDAALREVLLSYVAEGERHAFDAVPGVLSLYDDLVIRAYLHDERFTCGESEIDV